MVPDEAENSQSSRTATEKSPLESSWTKQNLGFNWFLQIVFWQKTELSFFSSKISLPLAITPTGVGDGEWEGVEQEGEV